VLLKDLKDLKNMRGEQINKVQERIHDKYTNPYLESKSAQGKESELD
jgi:hypothetical protein